MLGIDPPAAGGRVLGLLSLDDRSYEGEKQDKSCTPARLIPLTERCDKAAEHLIPPRCAIIAQLGVCRPIDGR